jgi:hypothetical protein
MNKKVIKPNSFLTSFGKTKKKYFEKTEVFGGAKYLFNALFNKKITYKQNGKNLFGEGSLSFFEAETLLIGANPILNALVMLYAARKNIPLVFCDYEGYEPDCWSYEFFNHSGFRTFFNLVIKFEENPKIKPDWSEGFSKNNEAKEYLDEFFQFVKSEISKTGFEGFLRVKTGLDYNLFKNYQEEQRVVYMTKSKVEETPKMQNLEKYAKNCFYSSLLKNITVLDFDTKSSLAHRIFAKNIILTSLVKGFSKSLKRRDNKNNIRLDYGDLQDVLKTYGSAKNWPFEPEKAIETTLADILDVKKIFL